MKRFYLLFGAALITLTGLLGLAKVTDAYNIHAGGNVSISQDKKIEDSIYTAGRTINIDSEVFGDVFCAGQNITVSGTVHGDVICAGQTVKISGKVNGDVRLAGQTITLGADITGNATIVGQSLVLESSGSIGGDLTTGAQDATLNGTIGRDIVIGSGNIIINNAVGRNIKAQSDTMRLLAGARVSGNIEITSQHNVRKDKQAVVSGKITRIEPEDTAKSKRGAIFGFGVIWLLYWLIALLATSMVLVLLFPRLLHAVTNRVIPRPWKALLIGLVASLAVPITIILLAVSLIGLPLAIIVGLLWLVALLLSGPVFGYYLGRLILRDSTQPLLIMLVGSAVLVVLYFIPVLGLLAVLAAVWTGTGMLLLEVFHKTPKPVYDLAPGTPNTKTRTKKAS